MMNGNLLSKSRLKIMSVLLYVTWVLVFQQFQNLYVICLLLPILKNVLNLNLADSTIKKPMGRINDVLILANRNYVPIDFIVLYIDCNLSCPIILGRPFLRTIGAVIDMKEGNIKFQFPLRKGMEQFPRTIIKPPHESIMRAYYGSRNKDDNTQIFALCLARG